MHPTTLNQRESQMFSFSNNKLSAGLRFEKWSQNQSKSKSETVVILKKIKFLCFEDRTNVITARKIEQADSSCTLHYKSHSSEIPAWNGELILRLTETKKPNKYQSELLSKVN